MRRKGRTDGNQKAIVAAFRQVGATVQILSGVGDGCPDLLIGYRDRNYLIEAKNGDKNPSARGLTAAQRIFHANWAGQVSTAESVEDAVKQLISLANTR